MENKIRNTLNEIYFGKTKDIVNGLRSVQPLAEANKMKDLQVIIRFKNISLLYRKKSIYYFIRGIVKKRSFYGQADRKGLTPPPLRSGCCDFFKISCHILTYFTIL